MFHFPSHERIRILLEDTQAGAGAEINALAMIHGAGIVFGVFDDTSAGSFIFRRLRWCSENMSQVIVLQIGFNTQYVLWRRMKSCAISDQERKRRTYIRIAIGSVNRITFITVRTTINTA